MLTDTAPTAAPPTTLPDAHGYFGPYGGMFVPETLMSPLRDLADEYERARRDPAFQSELAALLKDFAGRPTPLYFAERLTAKARRRENLFQARGPPPHRRAQDQQRARPDSARPADGQETHHRRNRRGPARRRHGHGRGALRLRVRGVHGCRGHAAAGAQRRADAFPRRDGGARHRGRGHVEGSHQRGDARLGHQRAHDVLHPRQRARLASVPDDGARFSPRHRRRGPRTNARARGPPAGFAHRVRRRRQQRHRVVLPVPRG